MQVGRKLGALLGSNPLPSLVREVAGQPPPPRTRDQRQTEHGDGHGEEATSGRPQPVLGNQEPQHAHGDEHHARGQAGGDDAGRALGQRRPCGRRPPLPLGLVRLPPDDADADGGDQHRPDECITDPEPRLSDQQNDAAGQEAKGDQVAPVRTAPARCRPRRRFAVDTRPLRHDRPEGGVEDEACPADEGEHDECDADGPHVQVEVLREPAADAGDDPVVRAAVQAALLRAGQDPSMIPWRPCVHIGARP